MIPAIRINQPAMDISETDKEVVVETELPDVDPKKIDVSVEKNMITIKGSSEEKKEEKKKNYYRKEIRRGSFCRSATLPSAVKEDKAKATYKNGILKVVIPKAVARAKKAEKVTVKEEK